MPWLYESFKRTMQDYIRDTWGWDELLQSHSFQDNLPPRSFTIAMLDDIHVGAFNLREKPDHLWLEMLLVPPEFQRQGIGTQLLNVAKLRAAKADKPMRLSVLKRNPAQHFYARMGFTQQDEDIWSIRMQWRQMSS